MAGLLGKIEQYDPEVEEWPQYVERLEHFFKANGIVGEANADKNTNHKQNDYRFRGQFCGCCGKKGHIARVCRKQKETTQGIKTVAGEAEVDYEDSLNAVNSQTDTSHH